jgi:hypothetical protein
MAHATQSAFEYVSCGPPPLSDASPGAMTPEKEDAIHRLFEITHTLQHARQMSQAAARYVGGGMKLVRPEQTEHAHRVLAQEADAVFAGNVNSIAAAMFPIYHQYFSHEEIEAMIEFNSSELGQKLLKVMPNVMTDVAQLTEDWARGLVPVFYKRALTRLRAEGIDV